MTSLNETKLDVLFRKLQDKKVVLKQEFDDAYAKDDFRSSVALMDSIQKLMLKLSSLEAIDKPFKSICKTVDKIEELKLAIEINFEELGKEVKNLDGLKSIFNSELNSELDVLLELFRQEEGKAFDFEWEQFTKDELMTIIHYNKSNFPSRLAEYEEYSLSIGGEQSEKIVEEVNVDLDVPLEVVEGNTLEAVCVFDANSEEEIAEPEQREEFQGHAELEFDHGMDTLSDFERQQHLPVLSDTETLSILKEVDEEPVLGASDIPFKEDSDEPSVTETPVHVEAPQETLIEDEHTYADDHLEIEDQADFEPLSSEIEVSESETYLDEEVNSIESTEEVAYADDAYLDEVSYEEEASNETETSIEEIDYVEDNATAEVAYEEDAYVEEAAYEEDAYVKEVAYEEGAYPEEVAYEEDAYVEEVAYEEDAYVEEVAYEEDAYVEEVAYEEDAYVEEV
ncbi:MAG: hypothetical protein KC646_17885, partial [Candidatus Cloacimonetes bacterium]|nr:hypothetical protein [Candidatus Cloacimonadota bacterium]